MNPELNPLALWNGSFSRLGGLLPELFESTPTEGGFQPAVDVSEDAAGYVLRAELSGLTEKDVQITFEDGLLTFRGERKAGTETTEGRWHIVERRSGAFERSFRLPGAVDESKLDASLKHGVLTIRLPKREETKPRAITIRSE